MANDGIKMDEWEEKILREAEALERIGRLTGGNKRVCRKRPARTLVATVRNRDRRGNHLFVGR